MWKIDKELKQSTNFQEIQNEKINQYDEKIKKYDEEIKELKEINSSNKEQINVITLFDEFTQKLYKERNRSIDNIKKQNDSKNLILKEIENNLSSRVIDEIQSYWNQIEKMLYQGWNVKKIK